MRHLCALLRQCPLAAVLCLAFSTSLLGDDWPQWRGPNRTDISGEKGLLTEWPKTGPTKLWTFEKAGLGYSGPAIANGRLYTMGSRDGNSQLIALDAETGDELWSVELGTTYENDWGNGPRGTPTVDEDRVYALSGNGDLICVQAQDGSTIWKKNFAEDFRGRIPRWGFSESVLVDGEKLVCTPGGAGFAVVALNKRDGSVIWESETTEPAQYSSIVPIDLDGKRHYIQMFMKRLVGISADDGTTIWEADFPGKVAVIPTPIVRGNEAYVSAGYGAGCMKVEFSNSGATELFRNKVLKNHHGGVILVGDYLYGHSDKSGWICQDFASGEGQWRARKQLGKGAIAYADGHFYCVAEDSGEVKLIEANPETWREKGSFVISPQTEMRKPMGRIWTHPVIANGRLYLRDQELIHCYDVRAASGERGTSVP